MKSTTFIINSTVGIGYKNMDTVTSTIEFPERFGNAVVVINNYMYAEVMRAAYRWERQEQRGHCAFTLKDIDVTPHFYHAFDVAEWCRCWG